MVENTLIAIAIIIIGCGLFQLVRRFQVWRATTRIQGNDRLTQEIAIGRPTILYFTAEWCTACKMQQRPAINDLKSQLGDRIQIVQIDVEKQPEDAQRWGVMSLPTTYVLNPAGEATAVNYGFAPVQKLIQQLKG